jgi:predicted RNase H-like nuclease (RuvC/YqgF family)
MRSPSSASENDGNNNRDYEGEHMRLVKHTPSAEEQSERQTRETMNKLKDSIIKLDDDIKVLTNEVKELKEIIKNLSGTTLKRSTE